MNKYLKILLALTLVVVLTACGERKNANTADEDELLMLEVDFIVPETADVGEEVQLEAVVTYGDEQVTDASEMNFEIWERGKKDESDTIEADNNDNGSYTIEYTFEHDGIYEMYAHTTAHTIHTMPKKEITIGEGGDYEDSEHDDDGYHTEGFDMHFMDLEDTISGEEQDLMVHIMLNDDAYEDLKVRYEIVHDGDEKHDWIDATEDPAGEYIAAYTFEETGDYEITIHVEDDEDLHEHSTVDVEVTD